MYDYVISSQKSFCGLSSKISEWMECVYPARLFEKRISMVGLGTQACLHVVRSCCGRDSAFCWKLPERGFTDNWTEQGDKESLTIVHPDGDEGFGRGNRTLTYSWIMGEKGNMGPHSRMASCHLRFRITYSIHLFHEKENHSKCEILTWNSLKEIISMTKELEHLSVLWV